MADKARRSSARTLIIVGPLLALGAVGALLAVVAARAGWHVDLMHLVLNMFGLWSTGVTLNRLYGNTQFLLIYFVSALTGSALENVAVKVCHSPIFIAVFGAGPHVVLTGDLQLTN